MRLGQLDPATAVDYGLFVQAAYEIYDHDPNNLNPSWTGPSFPSDYKLYLTIQMKEYFVDWSQRLFYGFFAQSKMDPNFFVVALRGTRTKEEWWLDFHWELVPCLLCGGAGNVASGFRDIYDTMTYMKPSKEDDPRPLREALTDVADGFQMTVTGHSLGSALITLFALEQTCTSAINPTIYTFASPRVGDKDFVTKFYEQVSTSHRVWNYWDEVTYWPKNLPWADQFYHVKGGREITSYEYVDPANLPCDHALNTYLYVLDRMDPNHSHDITLNPDCQWLDKLRSG